MTDTLALPIGDLTAGRNGRFVATVPLDGRFRPSAFAKTSQERAGKAPVLSDGQQVGTITGITVMSDEVEITVAVDDTFAGRPATLRYRPIRTSTGVVTEAAVWSVEILPDGPSPDLRRRRSWLAATVRKQET